MGWQGRSRQGNQHKVLRFGGLGGSSEPQSPSAVLNGGGAGGRANSTLHRSPLRDPRKRGDGRALMPRRPQALMDGGGMGGIV